MRAGPTIFDGMFQAGARNLDWADFLGELYKRHLVMLGDVAVGEPIGRSLRKQRVTYETIRYVRRSMADEAKECFGDDVLAEVGKTLAGVPTSMPPRNWLRAGQIAVGIERERHSQRRVFPPRGDTFL